MSASESSRTEFLNQLASLKGAFVAGLSERVQRVETLIDQIVAGERDSSRRLACEALVDHVHKLSGAGGTFGFNRVSEIASELERACLDVLRQQESASVSDVTTLLKCFVLLQNELTRIEGGFRGQILPDLNFQNSLEVVPDENVSVIFVDDDQDLGDILSAQLKSFGINLVHLISHQDLRQALEDHDPIAVIMDVMFPDGKDAGVEAVQRLKAENSLVCPVVYLSLRGDFEARLQAVRTGCDAYFIKPVQPLLLIEHIQRIARRDVNAPFRVLVVDDEIEVGDYNAVLLRSKGMDAEVISEPHNIMAALREFAPDVVLMDVSMPLCDGFEVARVIRQHDDYFHLPIVFLTSSTVELSWTKAMDSGADEFLRKGCANEELISAVSGRAKRHRNLTNVLERLKGSESRFRSIADTAVEGIFTIDRSFRLLYWNRAAERVINYQADEILGLSVFVLIPENEQPEFAVFFSESFAQDAMSERRSTRDTSLRQADGSEVQVELSLAKWAAGDQEYLTGVFRDISARKKAELEILNARSDADKANQAKSEFLSSMSHELRTPMNSIMGFTELLLDNPTEPLSENQRRFVKRISGSGEHLLSLINEILDLARIESGNLDITLECVDLVHVLEECVGVIGPTATGRNIRTSVRTPVTDRLLADESRLRQVLLNLLSNAVKYNRDAGTVSIWTEEQGDALVRIYIEDTGPGIPGDQWVKIFEPFNRLDATNNEIEGTGIGLTVTKQLVEAMNGQIGFNSKLGQGSTFWIALPKF